MSPRLPWHALVAVAIVAIAPPACGGRDDLPTHLSDGTPVTSPPVPLRGAGSHQIVTRAAVVDLDGSVSAPVTRCLEATRAHVPRAPIVLRTSTGGASVTFRTASGRDLVACDGTAPRRPWCGRALGRLHDGRLLDPRLELAGCSTVRGAPVAFAWVEADRRARYVAVRQRGFVEIYPVAARLPVRVSTTSGIDLETSTAAFEISEHDAGGRMVRSYMLRPSVAG